MIFGKDRRIGRSQQSKRGGNDFGILVNSGEGREVGPFDLTHFNHTLITQS